MKTLSRLFVLLVLVASSNTYATTIGENHKADCIESVQSGRFEGGEVLDSTREKTKEKEASSTSR